MIDKRRNFTSSKQQRRFFTNNKQVMRHLTKSEGTQLLNEIFQDDNSKRDLDSIMKAYQNAAEKFGLKIRQKGKGYFKEIYLTTNWENCDAVMDYLSSLGVAVRCVNDRISFKPNI